MLTAEQAKNEINRLTELLNKASEVYYNSGETLMDDQQFDHLLETLGTLEEAFPELTRSDSPTKNVGAEAGMGFRRVKHQTPMMSLENITKEGELRQWVAGICEKLDGVMPKFSCEAKLDGLSLSVLYRRGRLVLAATRGNGVEGDDVTENVRRIKGLPGQLTEEIDLELRGEVVLPWAQFYKLRQQQADSDQGFKNPRNAAAGSLRLKDPDAVEQRGLAILFFDQVLESRTGDHEENMQRLEALDLPVNPNRIVTSNLDEILEFCRTLEQQKDELEHWIDGVVIKVCDLEQRARLGGTGKYPLWARAWKFKPEQQTTELLGIENSLGRTGALTPVALLNPVELAGTTVARASLHNYEQVTLLGIHEGDHVVVEKSGEIIPQIVAVKPLERKPGARPVKAPDKCPLCKEVLYWLPRAGNIPSKAALEFEKRRIEKEAELLVCREKQLENRKKWAEYSREYSKKAVQVRSTTTRKANLAKHGDPKGEKQKLGERLDRLIQEQGELVSTLQNVVLIDAQLEADKASLLSELLELKLVLLGDKEPMVQRGDHLYEFAREAFSAIVDYRKKTASHIEKNPQEPAELSKLEQVALEARVEIQIQELKQLQLDFEGYRSRFEVNLTCLNANCPAKANRGIEHFVSKPAMDIDGLGPQQLEKFKDWGLIQTIPDIFRLREKREQLLEKPGYLDRSVTKLLDAIEKSKTKSLANFIFALGIPEVGTKTASDLAFACKSLRAFRNLTQDDLDKISGFGEKMISKVSQWLGDPQNQELIEQLEELGVAPQAPEVADNQPFKGQSVCITGTLSEKRSDWKYRLEQLGFQVTSSVSKKTGYLLAGEEAGSKLKKAQELGVEVMDEEQMRQLIGQETE